MRNSNIFSCLFGRLNLFLVAALFWSFPILLQSQPQFVAIGEFTAPFTDLNQAATQALDYDENGSIDIRPPCSCRATPTIASGSAPNGIFDNQLVIATGLSGQDWRLQTSVNLLQPSNLTSLASGTPFSEIGNTGVYVLPFAHRDDQIYFATVESPLEYPNQSFGPVFGECYYPHPIIENLPSFLCSDEDDIVLFGSAYSGFDDFVTPLVSQDEFWIIQRQEDLEVFNTQVFSPALLGEGTYDIRYTFNAGNQAYTDPNSTGCSVTVEKTVIVREEAQMVCFSELNVSIGPNCDGTIIPQQLLAAPQNTYEAFTIEVYDENNNYVGDSIAAAFHGQTLTARIIDDCSGNNCSTLLNIFDAIKPVLSIPPTATVACTESTEPEETGFASATDCSSVTVDYTDETFNSECGNPSQIIERTWTAIDLAGNESSQVQIIQVARGSQSQLRFPTDVTVDCAALQLNPGLTAPDAQGAGLPNLVDDSRCGLIYTSQDDTINVCGPFELLILREWTVLDLCGTIVYDTDGLGNDNMQLIRIVDETGPEVVAQNFELPANILPANDLEACRSIGLIPAPLSVNDDCSNFFVQIFTPIGEVTYIDGQDGSGGGIVPSPGLELGEHNIIYQATDDCGNIGRDTVVLHVIDLSPPMMLCNSSLNLTLSPSGDGRLYPEDIDEGSSDACCTGDLKIKLIDEPDSLFRDFIDFFCTNDTVTARIRLYDCAGNFNECDSKILVTDNVPVAVVSTFPDTLIECGLDYSSFLEADYRAPEFVDNCAFEVDFLADVQVNGCGIGQINRQWIAQDHLGNPPAIVNQTLTISAVHDYRFDIPGDRDLSCNSNNFLSFVATSQACDSMVVNVTEEIFTEDNDVACYRIRRIYDVYNYCQWDGISAPVQLPRRDGIDNGDEPGDAYVIMADNEFIYEVFSLSPNVLIEIGPSTGYYQYEQILSIIDNDPPTITVADSMAVCIDSTDCLAPISFDIFLSDSCSTVSNISYMLLPEGSVAQIDTIGTLNRININHYRIEGRYPLGNYSYLIQAADDCGNATDAIYDFSVLDCIAPQLVCRTDTLIALDNISGINLQAIDLVLSLEEDCNDGISAQISFSQNLADDVRFYDCDSLGQRNLSVYATDIAGNQTACTVTITISDSSLVCAPNINIDGFVRREDGDPIGKVWVELIGDSTWITQTDDMGYYLFEDMQSQHSYSLRPYKDTLPKNGVSVFDLIFMQRHILNVTPLTSPYKLIAGDVNLSGSISTFDVIRTRKVILDIDSTFIGNTSWNFVSADYVFPDTLNPWQESWPEMITIDALDDMTIDWIGMKTADLNLSADPLSIANAAVSPYDYTRLVLHPLPPSTANQAGFTIEWPAYTNIKGVQFSLAWDPAKWSFEDALLDGQNQEQNFNLHHVQDGLLSFVWSQTDANASLPKIDFHFTPLSPDAILPDFYIAAQPTPAEICVQEGDFWFTRTPRLAYAEASATSWEVSELSPNPWSLQTELKIYLPAPERLQLEVFNGAGQLVFQREIIGYDGLNRLIIDQNQIPGKGLYFYRLQGVAKQVNGQFIKL